jgi:imidazolonepropionase-like amidohydrolase
MGTLSGAEALGWDDETGSLVAGKSADLVVVPLPNEEADPFQLVFASSEPVKRTMFRGQWGRMN